MASNNERFFFLLAFDGLVVCVWEGGGRGGDTPSIPTPPNLYICVGVVAEGTVRVSRHG